MSDFKVNDLVRFKKVKGAIQYCRENSVLCVVDIKPSRPENPVYLCTLVFGAWIDDYAGWPSGIAASFYEDELEKILDPQPQEE